MEENRYRDTYHSINPLRCVFEKSINSRRCQCSLAERFNLADREGVRCTADLAQKQCNTLLETLRNKAIFVIQLTKIEGALPHAREIKVQTGGLLGIQGLIEPVENQTGKVTDIHGLINRAIDTYQSIDTLPYEVIIKNIKTFEGRKRPSLKKK